MSEFVDRNVPTDNPPLPEWTIGDDGLPHIHDAETDTRLRITKREGHGRFPAFWNVESLHTTYGRTHWTSICGSFDDEAAARADGLEYLVHRREIANLSRPSRSFRDGAGTRTPWGRAQQSTTYARGVQCYDTAGHGGFILAPTMNQSVHEAWRDPKGAYEEDSDWAIVAFTFPTLFTARELRQACSTLMQYRPHEYEAVTGEKVPLEKSSRLREEAFLAEHVNDLVVISAISMDDRSKVHVHAVLGGDRNLESSEFVVPADEYEKRSPFGFVIDPAKHEAYVKPETEASPAPGM